MQIAGYEINEQTIEEGVTLVSTYGIRVIAGIAILIVGWMIAKSLSGITRRTLAKSKHVDEMLSGFFAKLVKYLVMAVVIIAVLNQFGVQTTSLIAVLGAAGLAIGLALQGTLSNVAAGVMLLIFRPFKIGQYVEIGGQGGTVKERLAVYHRTGDARQRSGHHAQCVGVGKPGGELFPSRHAAHRFHSRHFLRRRHRQSAGRREAGGGREKRRVLPDPEPMFVVSELADSSVNLIARIWVNAADYWAVKFALTKRFKEHLEAEGLTIPFPQRDVHLIGQAGDGR